MVTGSGLQNLRFKEKDIYIQNVLLSAKYVETFFAACAIMVCENRAGGGVSGSCRGKWCTALLHAFSPTRQMCRREPQSHMLITYCTKDEGGGGHVPSETSYMPQGHMGAIYQIFGFDCTPHGHIFRASF